MRRLVGLAVLVGLAASSWAACSLNPQPIPPGDQPDASLMFPGGGGGDDGGGDHTSMDGGSDADAGRDAGDGGNKDAGSDAGDGGNEDGGSDAGDASDAGDWGDAR